MGVILPGVERDVIFTQFFCGIGTSQYDFFFCGSGTGEVWKSTPVSPSISYYCLLTEAVYRPPLGAPK